MLLQELTTGEALLTVGAHGLLTAITVEDRYPLLLCDLRTRKRGIVLSQQLKACATVRVCHLRGAVRPIQ